MKTNNPSPSSSSSRGADTKNSNNSVLLIGMGSSFAGMILAGFILGYFFDNFFDTKPFFIIGCGIMGFVGGLLKLHRMLALVNLSETESK